MKKGWLLFLVLAALLVLVPAVQAAPGDGRAGADRTAGKGPVITDPNQPIEVAAGETFHIVLDSNRTTGYGWQLAEMPDEAVVKKVNNRYRALRVRRPGSGGREIWWFQAVKPGTAEIRMVYVRSWEKGVEPARKAIFKVNVK
ncbi:MAG: hypothetical protein CVU61_03455 [Deltaproteobacteria bacterium HGW-Deltaproteobacteria-19]|jgi:inhibitor of cysteine peptidase|nr:MAG: hypothetical protein CVU61_03455 [Deltaproteobacteria bacterium HGW-Deltaproteobacteria-19]